MCRSWRWSALRRGRWHWQRWGGWDKGEEVETMCGVVHTYLKPQYISLFPSPCHVPKPKLPAGSPTLYALNQGTSSCSALHAPVLYPLPTGAASCHVPDDRCVWQLCECLQHPYQVCLHTPATHDVLLAGLTIFGASAAYMALLADTVGCGGEGGGTSIILSLYCTSTAAKLATICP